MQINGRENVIFSIFRDIEIAIYRGKKRGTKGPRTEQRASQIKANKKQNARIKCGRNEHTGRDNAELKVRARDKKKTATREGVAGSLVVT